VGNAKASANALRTVALGRTKQKETAQQIVDTTVLDLATARQAAEQAEHKRVAAERQATDVRTAATAAREEADKTTTPESVQQAEQAEKAAETTALLLETATAAARTAGEKMTEVEIRAATALEAFRKAEAEEQIALLAANDADGRVVEAETVLAELNKAMA
jgi:hypothetical protein